MPELIRIGTFNVENLFSRAKLLNLSTYEEGDQKLTQLDELTTLLAKSSYDEQDKNRIMELYDSLKYDLEIEETRGRLFRTINFAPVGVKAYGYDDWKGTIRLKRDDFDEITCRNTAKVIKEVNAHVMCLIEVEDRPALKKFNGDRLGSKKYQYNMLIDGNELGDRRIDVSLLSRFEIGAIYTHIFDKSDNRPIFSRDCLEVQLWLPNGKELWILINHFRSKYGGNAKGNKRRKLQAQTVADILKSDYDLTRDLVVVAGDLNDTPDGDPLKPLLKDNLYDCLEKVQDPEERWTHHYGTNQQIDYLLVSEPLKNAIEAAGVERRGMYDLHVYSDGAEKAWPTVQENGYTASASDHGAVWADFDLDKVPD